MNDGTWAIAVEGWIVQDGNYADFVVGQVCDFAVELFPGEVTAQEKGTRRASSVVTAANYDYSGEIVFSADGAWVMDVGLLVYGNRPLLPGIGPGDFVGGQGYLSIEGPGIYDTDFVVAAPPHRYSWRIERIELETTAWVEPHPRWFQRDPETPSYADIGRTNVWEDDPEHASPAYVLHCSLLSGPHPRTPDGSDPARRRSTPG